MEVKASFWKLLFVLLFAAFFGVPDYFLIRGQINTGLHPALIALMILISLLLIIMLYELPKWFYCLITRKPILTLDGDLLTESFHHYITFSIADIKSLEIKNVTSAVSAPVELRIILTNPNPEIGKRINIPSMRSTHKRLIIFPTTLGVFFGERKIKQLCNLMCKRNTSIKFRELNLLDKWSNV